MTLAERYNRIVSDLKASCKVAQRASEDVTIIAVSKTVDIDSVQEAIEAGIHDFGENRPQELARKYEAFPNEKWHFIGNIQSRQLKEIVGRAYLIHSVCKVSHLEKINRLAHEMGIIQDILLEVHNGEPAKQGIDPHEITNILDQIASFEHINVRGLMIMAPIGKEHAQKTFSMCEQLFKDAQQYAHINGYTNMKHFHELSMGMSDDYLVAIPCGTTMVRIGRAIFSDTYDQ